MIRPIETVLFAAFFCLMFVTSLFAGEVKFGDLIIKDPKIRATIASAPVSAGYLVVENTGYKAERLISVSVDFAQKSEIHTMEMSNGVMKMRPISEGLEIPATSEVHLKTGGNHLMFMKLNEPVEIGQIHEVTLTFETAGVLTLKMPVVSARDLKNEPHSGHSHDGNEEPSHSHN